MAKYHAYGTAVFKGTSGAGVAYFQVESITGPGLSVDMIDVTNHGSASAFEELVAGIIRTGEINMDIVYDPANATHKNASGGLLFDLSARASITLTIVFTDIAATEWTGSAFVTGFDPSMPHDDKLAAAVTFKPTGVWTLV